jgi:hypothetical protein
MPQEAKYGDHHQVTDGETVALKPLLVAERSPIRASASGWRSPRARPPQLGPFLAGIEDVDLAGD